MSLAGAHKIHRAWNTPRASQALLVRNPRAPILHIDDAAFPEAVLLQEVPHGCIVPVGIDADVGDPGQAVGQAFPENPLPGAICGDAVDGAVGGGVEPLPLLDDPVGGVFADDEGEDPANLSLLFQDMALPVLNILQQRFPGGPVVSPLAGISGLAHLFSRISVYFLNPPVIGGGSVADRHLPGILSGLHRVE